MGASLQLTNKPATHSPVLTEQGATEAGQVGDPHGQVAFVWLESRFGGVANLGGDDIAQHVERERVQVLETLHHWANEVLKIRYVTHHERHHVRRRVVRYLVHDWTRAK